MWRSKPGSTAPHWVYKKRIPPSKKNLSTQPRSKTFYNAMARRQGIFWLLTCPCPNSVISDCAANGSLPTGIVWMHGQQERGESTGYLHYQLVVAFSKKVALSGVKRVFGEGIHAELSRSEAAEAYCHKEETRVGDVFAIGAKPIRRNSKTDWESVWSAAKSGNLDAIPASIRVQSYSAIRSIRSDYSTCEGIEKIVKVFWGPTGTGKSRQAWEEAGPSAYSKCPRSKFWDGYQSEEHVVCDEFRGAIDISHLLRWCDRYPVRIEVKGSSRPLCATKIWFTSNLDPRRWYPDLDELTIDALLRRMEIIEMT